MNSLSKSGAVAALALALIAGAPASFAEDVAPAASETRTAPEARPAQRDQRTGQPSAPRNAGRQGGERGNAQEARDQGDRDGPDRPNERRRDTSQGSTSAADHRRLPPDSTTRQTLALPGRTLAFTATAGSIRLFDDKNEPEADIAYTAYIRDGEDPRSRPVTFVFNGGPGASSAWLQLGNAGPWRLPMAGEALSPSALPEVQPNAETWLDFTDLVFIDPVGTGYSRFAGSGEDLRKRYFSVEGDARSIARVIRRWVERSNRLLSPKYVMGESYGGIRGPKVVHDLQTREGIGVRGLILVSPVMDFRLSGSPVLRHVANLPTMTAVAREAKGPVTRADLADVEAYAQSDFLTDLVKGEADQAATDRLADKVSGFTGLDRTLVARLGARVDAIEFRRALDRADGRVAGRYDASVSMLDPFPDSSFFRFGDASSDPLIAPMTSAAVDLTTRRLGWRPEGNYALLSEQVNRAWDWGRGTNPVESVQQIRQILALDPKLKLIVAHGIFDLATPYFGSKIELDQLPPTLTRPDRVKLVVYPGGHMFYSREDSRKALRAEAEALMR